MRANIGPLDRIFRIIAGLVLIAYALELGFPHTGWNWIGWIGLVPLITAAAGICPAYAVFGISTCRR